MCYLTFTPNFPVFLYCSGRKYVKNVTGAHPHFIARCAEEISRIQMRKEKSFLHSVMRKSNESLKLWKKYLHPVKMTWPNTGNLPNDPCCLSSAVCKNILRKS